MFSADELPCLLDSRPLAVGLALQAALALFGFPSRHLTCLVIDNSLLFAGANHSEAAPWEPQAAAGAAGAGHGKRARRRARRRARPGRRAALQIGGRAPRRSWREATCQAPQGHGARSRRCEPPAYMLAAKLRFLDYTSHISASVWSRRLKVSPGSQAAACFRNERGRSLLTRFRWVQLLQASRGEHEHGIWEANEQGAFTDSER